MGDGLPGEPILLKHTVATAANPHGHFAPMNGNVQVEQSGSFNCALDAILPQLSEAKREELKDVNGLQEKMIEVIRNHPEKANEAYALGDKLAEIAPDKVISGGVILHLLDTDFWQAHCSGNKEEAQAIIDKWTDREIIGGKILAITATGIVVTLATGGTGFLPYVAGVAAATTVSIALDDKIRDTLAAGHFLSAAEQATYHFPFLGSGRHAYDGYKEGDKGKVFFHLGMLGVEGLGLRHAVKSGVKIVAAAEKALENEAKIAANTAEQTIESAHKGAKLVGSAKANLPFDAENVLKNASEVNKNGLTKAGRALQKHANRPGDVLDKVKFSGKTANQDAQKIIEEVLKSPNKVVIELDIGGYRVYDSVTKQCFDVSRTGQFNGFRNID